MAEKEKTLLDALGMLERGDWEHAHEIVQLHKTPFAYWLHGIVHLMEKDTENARYWYERAKRKFPKDAKAEIAAARKALDQD